MLTVKKVIKRYKNFELNIEKLRFEEGLIYGIVGHNGAGKTTLFKIITKLIEKDEGEIFLEGKEYEEIEAQELRKKITLVIENPYILRGSVWDNLEYGLKVRKINKKRRKKLITSILEGLKFSEIQHLPSNTLSYGKKQLLAIGRGIVLQPKVLLLDEPFTGVDAEGIYLVKSLIKKENAKSNLTVIIATKDVTPIKDILHHQFKLKEGKLCE